MIINYLVSNVLSYVNNDSSIVHLNTGSPYDLDIQSYLLFGSPLAMHNHVGRLLLLLTHFLLTHQQDRVKSCNSKQLVLYNSS